MTEYGGEERRKGPRARGVPARRRGDTLARLKTLKETISIDFQQTVAEWWGWLENLPEEKQLPYLLQVADFGGLLGIPVREFGVADDPIEHRQQEALLFFALAIWRLHESRAPRATG